MPELRLHHVSYPVRDVEVSTRFYQGIFGLPLLERPPFDIPGVWLGCGDRQIHLVLNRSGTFRSDPNVNIADTHFAFWTDDFEKMVTRLRAAGFSDTAAEGDPKRLLLLREGLAGFPQLYLLDPDYHTIEVNAAAM